MPKKPCSGRPCPEASWGTVEPSFSSVGATRLDGLLKVADSLTKEVSSYNDRTYYG